MPIYEARPEGLQPLTATSFEAEGWRERGDIQRLLKDRIASLEDGLMVLTDEFSGWADSTRRIDLLCLDDEANLVVVELKRNEDGGHMELQALRYAAMVSAMTFEQAVETLAQYRNRGYPDPVTACADILTFLGWSEPDEDSFAKTTRIILAAADFGKELTTTVLWLRDRGIDIRCVRLKPYRLQDGRLLMDIQPLIPLPEAADFQTRLGAKRAAEQRQRTARQALLYRFWASFLEQAKEQGAPLADRSPVTGIWLGGATGRQGATFYFGCRRLDCRAGLWLASDVPGLPLIFAELKAKQEELERATGASLSWTEPPESGGYSISLLIPGGYQNPEEDWPTIHRLLAEFGKRLWDEVFVRFLMEKQ